MWSNFKDEWISWWRGNSWLARLLPLIIVASHWGVRAALGTLDGWDILFGGVLLGTYYLSPSKQTLYGFVLPLYLGWLGHLAFELIPDKDLPRFTGKESLEIDRRFLSVFWQEKSMTVGEFLGLWVNSEYVKALESLLVTVPVLVVAFSGLLRFYYSTKGTQRYSAWGIDTLSPQMNWAILLVWLASHFGFPSVHVALMTVAVYYSFKFGVQRSLVCCGLVGTAVIALMVGRAYCVDVIFGIVEGLLFSTVSDMVAYQRPRRDAQKVWSPSIEKPTPPVRKRAG